MQGRQNPDIGRGTCGTLASSQSVWPSGWRNVWKGRRGIPLPYRTSKDKCTTTKVTATWGFSADDGDRAGGAGSGGVPHRVISAWARYGRAGEERPHLEESPVLRRAWGKGARRKTASAPLRHLARLGCTLAFSWDVSPESAGRPEGHRGARMLGESSMVLLRAWLERGRPAEQKFAWPEGWWKVVEVEDPSVVACKRPSRSSP